MVAWTGVEDLDKSVSLEVRFACVPLVYVYPAVAAFGERCEDVVTKVSRILSKCLELGCVFRRHLRSDPSSDSSAEPE